MSAKTVTSASLTWRLLLWSQTPSSIESGCTQSSLSLETPCLIFNGFDVQNNLGHHLIFLFDEISMEILASVDHNWFDRLDDCLKMPPKKYQRLTQFLEKNNISEERALRFMEYYLLLDKDLGRQIVWCAWRGWIVRVRLEKFYVFRETNPRNGWIITRIQFINGISLQPKYSMVLLDM